MQWTFLTLLLLIMLHGKNASGQTCIWKHSEALTFYGVVGKPARFSFESLTRLWDGNLFTWKLDETVLAVYQFKCDPMPRFVVDVTPSHRVNSSSKYLSKTRSEHSLAIASLSASDNGKQVTFEREGCSWATEKAKPVTLFISCCDPSVFGNDVTVSNSLPIKCEDKVHFHCNKTVYPGRNFTAICQSDSTWDIKQHTCELKVNQLSGGSIAAIVVGSFIVFLTILFGCVTIIRKKLNKRNEKRSDRGDSFTKTAIPLLNLDMKNENDGKETKRHKSQSIGYKLLEATKHKALPIINIKDGQVTLVLDTFEKILKQPEIGDKPIALISIAGTFRKGKSFIMNFFIRYMRNQGYLQEDDEWMDDDDCLVDDGFEWKSGIQPHTQGIMMYTKPFIVNTPNGEIALLFMDTQGLFDAKTGRKMSMMIFAFNTIISSVQILNISMNLQESDLEFLHLFTEYARTIRNESESDGHFLQSLKFLVRDWQFTNDHGYGSKGGEEYLESYMNTYEKNDELKSVREFISSKYKSISCFLMPHPGPELIERGEKVELKDLSAKFRMHLTPLAVSILHPKNLTVKKFCGRPINARTLYASATKFSKAVGKENLPNLTVMMNVVAEAKNNELRKECLDHYTAIMEENTKKCLSDENFEKLHDFTREAVIKKIFTKEEFGGSKNQNQAIKHVSEEIGNARNRFLAKRNHSKAFGDLNESKKYKGVITKYKSLLTDVISDKPIDPKNFDECEEGCWTKAKQEKDLQNVPEHMLKSMNSSRRDLSSLCRKENSEKYDLAADEHGIDFVPFKQWVQVDIRLRQVVNECLKIFDEETKQYSDVFVEKVLLFALLNERKETAIERYLFHGSQNATKANLAKHQQNLEARLNEKISVVEQENERNQLHFDNAKKEMKKRIIKKYHSETDNIIRTGFVVEASLKIFHENLIKILMSEISVDELPYFSNDDDDKMFAAFKNELFKRLDSLYQDKKMWNDGNNGIVVPTLYDIPFVGVCHF